MKGFQDAIQETQLSIEEEEKQITELLSLPYVSSTMSHLLKERQKKLIGEHEVFTTLYPETENLTHFRFPKTLFGFRGSD